MIYYREYFVDRLPEHHASLCLPMMAQGRTLGLLQVIFRPTNEDIAVRQVQVQHLAEQMVTSYRSQYPEFNITQAGANAFIAKPYHFKDFLDAIDAQLTLN